MSSLTHPLQYFLEWIMIDPPKEHDGKVSKGGRSITNLRFADDIDAPDKEKQELEALVENLIKACAKNKMRQKPVLRR